MASWQVKKSGHGQVVDLAQYEAVAQTNDKYPAALQRRRCHRWTHRNEARPALREYLRGAHGARGRNRVECGEDRLRAGVQYARPKSGRPLRRAQDDDAGPRPAVWRANPRLRRRAENVFDLGRIWRGAPSIGDDT